MNMAKRDQYSGYTPYKDYNTYYTTYTPYPAETEADAAKVSMRPLAPNFLLFTQGDRELEIERLTLKR
jgi:hypothetical protein